MNSIISFSALCIMTAQAVATDSQVNVMAMIEDTSEVDDNCCIFYDTKNFMISDDG